SLKDRTLMRARPHLVLDGGELAASSLGAEEVIVCVCAGARASAEQAAAAIAERSRAGDSSSPRIRLQLVPNHYLSGQESALGGYAGSWIDAGRLPSLALSDEYLAQHRARLGAGVVLLLSEHACPAAETARVARWLASQSSGQCGPCVNGLQALAMTLTETARGVARAKAEERIARLASLVQGRGACAHPDGAVEFILSAVQIFGSEF